MKITPKFRRGASKTEGAIKAIVEIEVRDAVFLAHLLSYARRAGMDSLDAREKIKAERILQRLAAVCEALDVDAQTHLDEHGRDYHLVRAAFDPGYEYEVPPNS